MFKNKKKQQEKQQRMLEEALEVTASDIVNAVEEKTVQQEPNTAEDLDTSKEVEVTEQPTPNLPEMEDPTEWMTDIQTEESPLPEDSLHPKEQDSPESTTIETEPQDQEDIAFGWIWYTNDEYEPKPRKMSKKERKKANQATDEPIEAPDFLLEELPEEEQTSTMADFQLPTKDKVDLNEFFEASKTTKKLKRSDRKKYSKKELKRRKKRQRRSHIPDDIKDQRVFKFRKKKYKEVEEFIAYLNDHYLDIDDVAHDVLADENFFGWVGKKSGVFPQSLQEFKEIKEKIENNQ